MIAVEAVSAVTEYRLTLTPTQANDLYNEVYAILRDRGVVSVHDRPDFDARALYALYDGLYAAGIDGSRS